MQLSYSRVSAWKNCRRAYYYSYDLNLEPRLIRPELTLGKSIHNALAEFYSLEPCSRTKLILDTTYENSMHKSLEELELFKGGLETKDRESFTKNIEKGRLWLNSYWDKYNVDDCIPKAITEQTMEFTLDDTVFVIRPDAIINRDDGVWIWENRTGNPDMQQLLMEDEQSLYYAFGLRQLSYPVKGVIYNLISNPTRISDGLEREEIERTDIELAGIGDEIKQIASEIQTLPRYPNRGFSCKFCSFRELCYAEWAGGDVQWLISKDFQAKGNHV